MSNDIVDTNRPEYSWIPFFEELAQRLHEDGWRHRQPDIVAKLQEMKRAELKINPWVDNLRDTIDPFSVISMIRRLGFDEATKVMEEYKRFFDLGEDVRLPRQSPITPSMPANNSMFFSGEPDDSQIEPLWDLLAYVMSTARSDDHADNQELVDTLNRSVDVKGAGVPSITGALYWIQPHRFLKTDTVDHFFGRFNYREFGSSYLYRLNQVRERLARPFPELNNEAWFVKQFRDNPDKSQIWQVRGGKFLEYVKQFLNGGYTGIHFDVDEVDLSVPMNEEQIDTACREQNPDLGNFALGQIRRFAREIRSGHIVAMPTATNGARIRYGFATSDGVWHVGDDGSPNNRLGVCWRPNPVDGEDLPLPGPPTVQVVTKAHDELLSRLKMAEGIEEDDVAPDPPEGKPRVWLVRSNGGTHAPTVAADGYVGIGWNQMVLSGAKSRDDVSDEHLRCYPAANQYTRGQEVGSINRFLFHMRPGDFVLTPDNQGYFYYGVVTGETTFEHEAGPYGTRRTVDWSLADVRDKSALPDSVWNKHQTVIELNVEEREAFHRLITSGAAPDNYDYFDMLNDGVFMDLEDIRRMDGVLRSKKNIILQGPPGVGKTFVTKRLAYVLMGERADSRIASVQFHQSYSYEDFVGGYRPALNDEDQLIFDAKDGAFLRLCEQARLDPTHRYVMLIDEINRGNLSRVFGELLMLIEADKRAERHAVELPHRVAMVDRGSANSASFYVPPNVYIIGTMNLADRSLTGMNVAMRRRFGFAELRPQFGETRFRNWLNDTKFTDDENMPKSLQNEIHRRMARLNETIANDSSLGKQYAVGHSFFCPDPDRDPPDGDWREWYEVVVEYEIRPLLEEYWFDAPETAKREADNLKDGMPFGDAGDRADAADAESEELKDD